MSEKDPLERLEELLREGPAAEAAPSESRDAACNDSTDAASSTPANSASSADPNALRDELEETTDLEQSPDSAALSTEPEASAKQAREWEAAVTEQIKLLLNSGETFSFDVLSDSNRHQQARLDACLERAISEVNDANREPADSQSKKPVPDADSNSAGNGSEASPPAGASSDPEVTTDQSKSDSSASAGPTVLGRYRIEKTLGSGGFGVVYQGWDSQLQRKVAIKVARRTRSSGRDAELAEARFLAQLDHAGIVPVYDVGETEESDLYVVSKFIDGCDLGQYRRQNKLKFRESVTIVGKVAEALDYAHSHGVFHRDVKPGNILITQDMAPVLVDFGLAIKEADFGQGSRFVGTPAYMSPEQARREGHRVDGRSDIYSLGAVLYLLLTGSRPFNASSIPALLELIRSVEARPPRQIDRNIPRELERICLRALSKRVGDRYSTACDMADDLNHWLQDSGSVNAPALPKGPSTSESASDALVGSKSQDLAIVPRGLRAFESTDADFFLRLLPGPVDRNGLPESIRFWKTRIEETESENTFRVGVLLGPSGSGKSSLVRAGIVPRLSDDVVSVWIDTRRQDLERRLLRRLRKRIPALENARTLHDALVSVRQNRGLAAGKKLLLVFDQFEQWLSYHRGEESSDLAEVLRQCDGVRSQALLLIRDDFTLAAADFMDQIEEPLSQTRNFATMDLFGKDHARNVLTAFGRAFGAITDSIPREQQRFLDSVIDGLAESGRIIPIQIALFADMVKEKPWTMATLREYGGMRGIGVAFLEEKLAGVGAHPYLRSQAELTRNVLRALLPDDDEVIKATAKTRGQLLQEFSHVARPDTLDRVLGLLDSELRLITPSGGDPAASAESTSSVREPAYQLTHDYLVPTIREWLTASERATRKGRVRLRLSELAESWNARPDPRRLPTVWEWASIRRYTRSGEWNGGQRAMMRAAERRIGVWTASIVVLVAALAYGGYQASSRIQAAALCEGLLNADTSESMEYVQKMRARWNWVEPLVAMEWRRLAPDADPADPRIFRQRLHVAMAMVRDQPLLVGEINQALPRIEPSDLATVRSVYADIPTEQLASLWQMAREQPAPASHRLAAAAVLAFVSEKDSRWDSLAPALARDLTGLRPVQLAQWILLFVKVGDVLLPELEGLLNEKDQNESVRANAAEAISIYAKESPEILTRSLGRVDPSRMEVLLQPIHDLGETAVLALRRRFEEVARDPHANVPEIPELATVAAAWDGAAYASGGFAASVPLESLDSFFPKVVDAGFEVKSLRLHAHQGARRAALSWAPAAKSAQGRTSPQQDPNGLWAVDLTRRELEDRLQLAPRLIDLDWSMGDDGEPRYTALWDSLDPAPSRKPLIHLDVPMSEHWERMANWVDTYSLRRVAVRETEEGLRSCEVWEPTDEKQHYASSRSRYAGVGVETDIGYLQFDCRHEHLDVDRPDRSELLWLLVKYEKSAKRRFTVLKTLARLGRYEELRTALAASLQAKPGTPDRILLQARAAAGIGDEAGLADAVATLASLEIPEYERLVMQVRLHVLRGEMKEAEQQLAALRELADKTDTDETAATAEANVAAARAELLMLDPKSPDASRKAAAERLRSAVLTHGLASPEQVLNDVEFDSIRGEAAIQEVLRERGMFARYLNGSYTSRTRMSETLWALPLSEHCELAARLASDGYAPTAVHVAWDPRHEQWTASSCWGKSPPAADGARETELALLAIALAECGEAEYLREVLRDGHGRTTRSLAIELLRPTQFPPTALAEMFRQGGSSSLKRSVLLALGGFPLEDLGQEDREFFTSRIQGAYKSEGDPGLRAAFEWCARQWEIALPPLPADQPPRGEGKWYLNPVGQTMVVFEGCVTQLGSPFYEPGRHRSEDQHRVEIPRRFSIADKETTIAQFQRFLEDPKVRKHYQETRPFQYAEQFIVAPDQPQISVNWMNAAKFCQWLSEKEGLDESQWCYPGIWDTPSEQFRLPPDYLTRTGYRLPTEAEWEHACRGGSLDSRSFGMPDALIPAYAWCLENAGERVQAVGRLKPNEFGMFDMLGNVGEWCQDRYQYYYVPPSGEPRVDAESEDLSVPPDADRVQRGRSYMSRARDLRSADRSRAAARLNAVSHGFRPARTEKP